MTIIYHYETFVTNAGQTAFIERYADSPHFTKYWRYGVIHNDRIEPFAQVYKESLLSRPNKKRIKEIF